MTTDLAARVVACLGLLASGCSLALDFGPDVLLPALDAGAPASVAADADVDVGADAEDCATSACRTTSCRAPEVECGTRCVDLQEDNRNCGACGASCGPGATRCCRGVCAARCE